MTKNINIDISIKFKLCQIMSNYVKLCHIVLNKFKLVYKTIILNNQSNHSIEQMLKGLII